jgi:predicted permease
MRRALRRLANALPADAARDWLTPALHDLEIQHAQASTQARGARRALGDARLAVGAGLLYLECLRLVLARFVHHRTALRAARRRQSLPRKDWSIMLVRDLRHAVRLFHREPAFSLAAVLTLALGLGATTALFAVVEAVLLRPLPYADAGRLVSLRHRDVRTGITKDFVALGDVIDLRARQQSLDMLVAFSNLQTTLIDNGEPVRVLGLAATPDLFGAFRLEPALGRFFEAGDSRQGAPPVVVISHHLWTTRFASRPDAIGRSIQMGNTRRTIVGVAPRGFSFPPAAVTDVLVPMALPSAAPVERRAWIHAMGRLESGVTIEQANAELAALSRQFEQEFPAQNLGTQYDLLTVRDAAVGDTRRPLLLTLAAVGFVLLIACANVGNLLVARSLGRQQELSLRLALGAGRGQLGMQLVTEGLVLAVAGGLAGVALAWWSAPALAALVPQSTVIPGLADVGLNIPVLLFSLVAALLSAAVFSAVAMVGIASPAAATVATRRMTMSAGARRAASGLVAAQMALAVVLLLGAGLALRSFGNLIAIDPGFHPERVVSVQIGLPAGRYPDANARRAVFDRTFAALRALPGVEEVGAGVVTPLTGNNWTLAFERPDHPVGANERPPEVGWQQASGGYFRTLRIPLRAGRLFDDRDRPDTAPVVIISEALAARYFAGEHPIGQRVKLGTSSAEVVGVVGDIRRAALAEAPRADMYLPFERGPGNGVGLFIRTSGHPIDMLPDIRSAIRGIEPQAVLFDAESMEDIAARSAALTRLVMRLLAGFAIVALLLAAIGVYAVMSYSVRRRTRELGTRLALGATRREISAMVLRQAMTVAGIGLAVGLGIGLAAARSLGALLFGVPPWDPVSVTGALAVLAAATLAAGYLPARRAARIDPARTLASE